MQQGCYKPGRRFRGIPGTSAHLLPSGNHSPQNMPAAGFVHSSCLERQRASRLNALAERLESSGEDEDCPALRRSSEKAWFGFAATTEISEALKVLRLAEKFSEEVNSYDWNRIRSQLTIIPTQSGDLVAAPNAVLAPEDVSVPGRAAVSAELSATSEARRILIDVLSVKEPDSALWTELLGEALGVPSLSGGCEKQGMADILV